MRKYLNYLIFGIVVLAVVGLALRHSQHMRALVNDMANGTPQARAAAATELIKAEQFMDSITGEPVETRVKVADALEALGTVDAVKQAINMLKDQDKPVREAAVRVLQNIGAKSPENITALVEGLKNGDSYARKGTIQALTDAEKGIGPKPGVVEAIVKQMKADGAARGPGGDVLGHPTFTRNGANKTSLPLLIEQMQDKDEGVRTGAAEALGKTGDQAAIPTLKTAMEKDTAQVRRVAIGAIALIADGSGEDALVEAISNPDDDNEARAQAAAGLGKIASSRAIATLITALNDDDLKLRSAAVAALARAGRPVEDGATNPTVIAALNTALSDSRAPVRLGAAQSLQVIASTETTPALIALLKNANNPEDLRAAAALALGFKNNASAVAPLIASLSDDSGEVVTASRDALAAIGEPANTALLTTMQQGGPTAYYAAQAFASRGAEALPALEKAAKNPNPVSQRWAAVALGGLGVAEAKPLLEELEKSSDPDVAFVAREQLERFGRKQ